MSYDVSVGSDSFNYTSNMGDFFAFFGCYPPALHGLSAAEAADVIQEAVCNIICRPVSELDAYDDPGAWGNWEGALAFLMKVRDACHRAADDQIVKVDF